MSFFRSRYVSHRVQRVFLCICLLTLSRNLLADDNLEEQYQKSSAEILKKLRAAGIKTTGVLKFSVRVGDGAFSAGVGNLNMRLAEKLEVALVLANPADKKKVDEQVVVARAASDVADTIEGATHLTEEGRQLLFSKPYPLAWKFQNQSEAVPDSLIAGVAQINSSLSQMDIELLLVTKKDFRIERIDSFSVPTDLEDLIDGGESFSTRGLFDDGSISQKKTKEPAPADESSDPVAEKVKAQALLVRKETLGKSEPQKSSLHPLAAGSTAPISFEIWYDNQIQPIEFRDGAAFIKEPNEGQDVILSVRRRGTEKTRYGVLIRVNGENTLFKEKTPDAKASLWILEPDAKEFGIRGYQIDQQTREAFKVLSNEDSQKRSVDYGRDVGMISVVVFEESKTPPTILSDDKLDLALQSQAKLPEKTAETRGDAGRSLFDQLLSQDTTRGLIVDGERTKADIATVTFERNLTPVMATSVRYFAPK